MSSISIESTCSTNRLIYEKRVYEEKYKKEESTAARQKFSNTLRIWRG